MTQETDVEQLQQRDYANIKVKKVLLYIPYQAYVILPVYCEHSCGENSQDASLLRFLVDMRGVDVDDRQVKYRRPTFQSVIYYSAISS